MKVLFINNSGAGFAGSVEVAEGTTVAQLFATKVGGDAADYSIRVNGRPVRPEEMVSEGDAVEMTTHGQPAPATSRVIEDGDRITVAPKNVAGAK
jgi:sulfur carrier protein ThiS